MLLGGNVRSQSRKTKFPQEKNGRTWLGCRCCQEFYSCFVGSKTQRATFRTRANLDSIPVPDTHIYVSFSLPKTSCFCFVLWYSGRGDRYFVSTPTYPASLVVEAATHRHRPTTQFLYLGRSIHESSDLSLEVERRTRLMWACLKRFGRELNDTKTAPRSLKVRMLKAEAIETPRLRCVT